MPSRRPLWPGALPCGIESQALPRPRCRRSHPKEKAEQNKSVRKERLCLGTCVCVFASVFATEHPFQNFFFLSSPKPKPMYAHVQFKKAHLRRGNGEDIAHGLQRGLQVKGNPVPADQGPQKAHRDL